MACLGAAACSGASASTSLAVRKARRSRAIALRLRHSLASAAGAPSCHKFTRSEQWLLDLGWFLGHGDASIQDAEWYQTRFRAKSLLWRLRHCWAARRRRPGRQPLGGQPSPDSHGFTMRMEAVSC